MKKFVPLLFGLISVVLLSGCGTVKISALPYDIPYYDGASFALSGVSLIKVEAEGGGYAPYVFVTVNGDGLSSLTSAQIEEAEKLVSTDMSVEVESKGAKIPKQLLKLNGGKYKVAAGETAVMAYTYAGGRYSYMGDDKFIDFSQMTAEVTVTVEQDGQKAKKYTYKLNADTKSAYTLSEAKSMAGMPG